MDLFKDILKEKFDNRYKYSQGRVYLFISFIIYILLNVYVAIVGLYDKNDIINFKIINLILESIQWILLLLASYVFGGKSLDVIKLLFHKPAKTENTKD